MTEFGFQPGFQGNISSYYWWRLQVDCQAHDFLCSWSVSLISFIIWSSLLKYMLIEGEGFLNACKIITISQTASPKERYLKSSSND